MTVPNWQRVENAVLAGWSYRSAIQFHVSPKHWPAALELIPDAAARSVAEVYLRGMAERMRERGK